MTTYLSPYEELECRILGSQMTLETPWMQISGELEPEAVEYAEFCAARLHDPEERALINEFLKPFRDYPVAYWHAEPAGDGRLYAPLALSMLRRQRLLASVEAECEAASALSREGARIAVRQNHFIAANCDRVLARAASRFPSEIAAAIEEFRSEEHDHDLLIAKAVELAGAAELPVLPEIQAMLDIFAESANGNLLELCACIDFFEGVAYTMPDSPLAAEVERHLGQEVAAPLRMHHAINQSHAHSQFAMTLLEKAPGCTDSDVARANALVRRLIQADRSFRTKLFGPASPFAEA